MTSFTKNEKYFHSSDLLFYIGVPILAVGVILFVLAQLFYFYLIPYQDAVALVLAGIGALIAFVPRSMRAGEDDLDAYVASMLDGYAEQTATTLGIRQGVGMKPTVIGDYVLDEKDVIVRRGKDDRKLRSSLYAAAAILFTKDGLCISRKIFSLTSPDVSEKVFEFFYHEITHAQMVEETCEILVGGEKERVCTCYLVLYAGEKIAFRLTTTKSAVVEKICEDINFEISRRQA